jgi:hypothetical protein
MNTPNTNPDMSESESQLQTGEIKVIVENQTEETITIVLYLRDPQSPELEKLTPPAPWKLFPLKPTTPKKKSKGTALYSNDYEIEVTRRAQPTDDPPIGDLEATIEAQTGDIIEYTRSADGTIELQKSAGKSLKDAIEVSNNTRDEREVVEVKFLKNGALFYPPTHLPPQGRISFTLLTNTLYAAWTSPTKEENNNPSDNTPPNDVRAVDMNRIKSSVTLTLTNPGQGGEHAWAVETI